MKTIVSIIFLLVEFNPTISLTNSKFYRNVHIRPGRCFKNQTKYPFIFEQKHIKVIGGVDKIWMDIRQELLEDLHGPFKVVTKVSRCNLNDHNNCEPESGFTIPDVCVLQDNFRIMTRIVFGPMMAFEPQLDCVNSVQRKGTYMIRNYTLDLQPARLLPIGGYLWRLKEMRSFQGKENLLCIDVDVVVRNVK